MTDNIKFPSQVVSLPSKGWFYSETHPLSSGEIELKYPTAKEEDILTDLNLVKKGVAYNMFLESIIVDKNIKLADILTGDVNAITIGARILAYGPEYIASIKCPSCKHSNRQTIDLSDLKSNPIDTDSVPKGTTEFTFKLPISEVVVTYVLSTQGIEDQIKKDVDKFEAKMHRKNEITGRLSKVITSVDGNRDASAINKFVYSDSFISADSLALRKDILKHSPSIDMGFEFICDKCNYSVRRQMPMGIDFFWPGFEI